MFSWKKTKSNVEEFDQPMLSELNGEHREFIAGCLGLADGAGVDLEDPGSVAEFYDLLLGAWQSSPDGTTDPEPYINAAGVAFGEHLVRTTPLRWVVAEDSTGRELAVHSERTNFFVYPLDAVQKRWVRGEGGEFITTLAGQVVSHFKIY
ncbi:DUF3806 domain-containing protein [Arthrobacter sp. ISL-95]|uniref:DUF3806 domain-containing protein n=1 Tax=Arthrobacter sp. ISL-95 TaxID=2819116 RepID=UPI001BE5B934|nr:DUF3806 domain-containing protein [Arthrobacter sp. ISL-95]MBT2585355.1 DUF3806 domain-containing protein [Arthrobacter sp. ISL-95]